MTNARSLFALLLLAACGPAVTPEPEPAQDTSALVSPSAGQPAALPGCDTVRIDCPYGGTVSCRSSNTVCILGQTSCSVICDGIERYCGGTTRETCPF